MSTIVDARGLSCPQPVILADRKIRELGKGVLEVLVDTETSKENISRLAQKTGWNVEVKKTEDHYCLVLRKE